MNYDILALIISIILLLVTYMQYSNNKNNFLNEKLPILNIKKIEGFYENSKLLIIIILENRGNSPAVDIILKCQISEIEKSKYNKINFLKDNKEVVIQLEFDDNETKKFVKRLNNNEKLFIKLFKDSGDKYIRDNILLPVLSLELFYRNIFRKAYKLNYSRGIYKFNNLKTKDKKIKIINFISENTIEFSIDKLSNRNFKRILKKHNDELPFEKTDDRNIKKCVKF